MHRCLQLAKNGLGSVAPNPMVGCVIVHGGKIIEEGYHQVFGGAHAEVNAINSVTDKSLLRQSTIYVSLEPCSHFGKTPPCADLIIKSEIPRAVIAIRDPNPLVAGRGIERLKSAGVEVIENICESEATFLNRRFITHHLQKRPYIILKWAQSADGFMDRNRADNEDPKINWISHPRTKKQVHLWRSQEQAIMVGKQTIINDNPQLDTREIDGPSPLRIVLAGDGSIPKNSKVLTDGKPTILFNTERLETTRAAEWIKTEKNNLTTVLRDLGERGISSVLVEGGAKILSSFIAQNLWDEVRIIQSTSILGSGLKAPSIHLKNSHTEMYGSDRISTAFRV